MTTRSAYGMLETFAVTELDVQVFRALHHALSGRLVLDAMAALTLLGGGWPLLMMAPFLVRERTRRLSASLLGVALATTVFVFVLKRIVTRLRPCVVLSDVQARIFPAPTDFSFPSGHSAGAFALASFFACMVLWEPRRSSAAASWWTTGRRLGVVALLFALALGIGLSRIALGVHFPSDVAAGALVGVVVGTLGGRLYVRGLPKPELVADVAPPVEDASAESAKDAKSAKSA